MANTHSAQEIVKALIDNQQNTLAAWFQQLTDTGMVRENHGDGAHLKQQMANFLALLAKAAEQDPDLNVELEIWAPVRIFLEELSRARAIQGSTASETAMFVYSIKRPLFSAMEAQASEDGSVATDLIWKVSSLLDQLGIHTFNAYLAGREQVIRRQQEELLELSTPVIKIWDGVLALPMIGTLDSNRTQVVMETLLQRIVETGSELAIIDITGVPTVDTLVAQHLIKTVTAIRLMGAECIVSGIRPQIAQTIVHLGVDLQGVTTKATLADALSQAFRTMGLTVVKAK
jgi:rsbT co-antagonist protein RsbR